MSSEKEYSDEKKGERLLRRRAIKLCIGNILFACLGKGMRPSVPGDHSSIRKGPREEKERCLRDLKALDLPALLSLHCSVSTTQGGRSPFTWRESLLVEGRTG